MIDEKRLIEALASQIFSAEVYNDDFDGVVIRNLLCLGDVTAEVMKQLEEQSKIGEWIPCEVVDHPEHCRDCEVTRKDTIGVVRDIAFYAMDGWRRTEDEMPVDVIAWKEPSRPYKE